MQEQDTTVAPEVEYRDIPDFPGYRVGNDGTVWSCRPINGRGPLKLNWRKLRLGRSHAGYRFAALLRNGKVVNHFAHRLVLAAFVGECPEGMQCRHLDGDASNNWLGNLAWGTPIENMSDKKLHGTYYFGNRHHNSKISDADAIDACSLYDSGGWTHKQLAKKYSVSTSLMQAITSGKARRHLNLGSRNCGALNPAG